MSSKNQHFENRALAEKAIIDFRQLQTPQQQFYFLRKLDPFVFEEMILSALRRQGYRIIRNKAYTNDGGVDGMVFMNMKRHLIQAKCYNNHIKASDVASFSRICKRRNVRGLFVHTGKTGSKSWDVVIGSDVEILSGHRMLNLFSGLPFRRKTELTDHANKKFSIKNKTRL